MPEKLTDHQINFFERLSKVEHEADALRDAYVELRAGIKEIRDKQDDLLELNWKASTERHDINRVLSEMSPTVAFMAERMAVIRRRRVLHAKVVAVTMTALAVIGYAFNWWPHILRILRRE